MSDSSETFDRLFASSDDPWGFRTRWYEERKRALTLACLPARRYRCAYEPGCANGELSASIAPRCDRLLVSDIAEAAVALARERLAAWPHASAFRASVPTDWPEEPLDLVVISELGYYLPGPALAALADKVRDSLAADGTLLACHWRHPIAGCERDGDEVHRVLGERLGMHSMALHLEPDFRMEVWSADARTLASREGLA